MKCQLTFPCSDNTEGYLARRTSHLPFGAFLVVVNNWPLTQKVGFAICVPGTADSELSASSLGFIPR